MASLQLSTLDQNASSSYTRYALIFACEEIAAATACERLQKAVSKAVSELPVLSGTVKKDEDNALAITTSLQEIKNFAATMTLPCQNGLSIHSLCGEDFPPAHMMGEATTPLLDAAESSSSPVFAVKANFIQDGLVLVIYLHRLVADIKGVSSILRAMSEDLPLRKISADELADELAEASDSRGRLSTGAGAPAILASARRIYQQKEQQEQQIFREQQIKQQPQLYTKPSMATNFPPQPDNRAAILSFDLEKLTTITDAINTRRSMRRSGYERPITTQEVLLSLVWRLVTRAKYPSGSSNTAFNTSIVLPIDIRSTMSPPLEQDFLGNATVMVYANQQVDSLSLYYDVGTIELTATILASAKESAAQDLLVRAEINMLNQEQRQQGRIEADLRVVDWSASQPQLEFNQMDLGLGLGEPICVRKIGREVERDVCVVLPVGSEAWEVQLELEAGVMAQVMEDERLWWFLRFGAV